MEAESSSPWSQQPATGSDPELDWSDHAHTQDFWKIHFNIMPRSQKWFYSLRFSGQHCVCIFHLPEHATRPANLIPPQCNTANCDLTPHTACRSHGRRNCQDWWSVYWIRTTDKFGGKRKMGTRQSFMEFKTAHDLISTGLYSISIEFGMQEKNCYPN
jgi:hypothetical protein